MLPSSVVEAYDAERAHWTPATVAGLCVAKDASFKIPVALDAMSRGEQRRLGCRQLMSFCHLVRIVGLANGAEPRAGERQSVLRALTHASDTLMGRRGLGASSSCPTAVEFWA